MKEGTRRPLRQELEQMLTEGQDRELLAYAERVQGQLLSDWTGGKVPSVRTELRYTSALLTHAGRYLREKDESRYAAVRFGALVGTVECFERILYEQDQNIWAEMRFEEQSVKHLPEIVQALETHGPMSHTELGRCLGMKAPTLSEAMKKVLNTGAIRASTLGKFKMYSLTDAGLRYGKELRKKRKQDVSLTALCEQIDQLLRGTADRAVRETIQSTIRERLGDEPGVNVRKGDTLHLCSQEHPEELPLRFKVGDMPLNTLDGRDKGIVGSWETALKEATNTKPPLDAETVFVSYALEGLKTLKVEKPGVA